MLLALSHTATSGVAQPTEETTSSEHPSAILAPTAGPTGTRVLTDKPKLIPIPLEPTALGLNREAPKTDQQNTDIGKQEGVFWNAPLYSELPGCTTDFGFTNQLVDPEDVAQIMFGVGSHISPHDHMVYWGVWPLRYPARHREEIESPSGEKRQISERVQLYAPVDFFYVAVYWSVAHSTRTCQVLAMGL